MDQGTLILLARVCVSLGYVYSSVDKSVHWPRAIEFCVRHGMPQPRLVLAATIVVQFVAGLMVLLGWYTGAGALVLALFTFVATLWVHWPFGRPLDDFRREMMTSLEHLSIVGGLLFIAAVGPGPIALMP